MILVAEDHPVFRAHIAAQLKQLGYESMFATCGATAIRAYRQGGIALILMDIQMPNVDGLEATRKIREIEKREGLARVPIVALTTLSDRQTCLDAGMDDYYEKPLEIGQLEAIVEKWQRERLRA